LAVVQFAVAGEQFAVKTRRLSRTNILPTENRLKKSHNPILIFVYKS